MQPETRFKMRVRADLEKAFGDRLWTVKVQQRGLRGTPDLLCCIDGSFVAIELKRHIDCAADPLQNHTLGKIKTAGGIAICVSPQNWAAALLELRIMLKF